jgi:GAF domain-containing protein
MKCPRCVHENRATAKFCEACATPLNTVSPDRPNAPSYAELNSALSEALEQQMATGEVLQIISRSPTDLQPVLDTVVKSAARFCGADDAIIFQLEGAHLRLAAHYGPVPARVGVLLRIAPDTVVARAVLERRAVHTSDVQSDPEEYPETSAVARKLGYRTQLSVPLLREATAIGAVSLRRSDVNPFTDKQITLLQTFADQAVIAIENVRLFNELQTRNTELTEALDQQTATAEILRVISRSPTDVQPVFDAVAQNAATLCQAQFCHVFRFDGTLLHIAAHYGLPPEGLKALQSLYPAAPGQGSAAGRSLLSRHVEQIPDINADADYRHSGAAAIMNYRSIVAVPMLRDGMPVGCIVAGRSSTGSFPERLVRLLQTFADQAVIAIENVRLFNETKEALDQQTVTADILRVIASSPTELQPVLDAIATNATLVCDAYDAVVFLREGDHVRPAAHHGPITITVQHTTLSRGSITETAILDRQPVHVHDVLATEPRAFPLTAKAAREGGFRTVLAVPLLREHEAIGALAIRRREVQPFTPQQIALVQTFADQAVIAIENVRLFTELQANNRALTQAHAQVSESLEQQTATAEILRVISSSPTDVQPVFDTIVERAARLCDAEVSLVARLEGDWIHVGAVYGTSVAGTDAVRRTYPMRPGAEGATARAIRDSAIAHIPDVLTDGEFTIRDAALAAGFRAVLAVPMLREGRAIGAISIGRAEAGEFSTEQVNLLRTFADQAIIAIENVRLFKELEARTQDLTRSVGELRALSEVGQAISSTLDLQTVLRTIVARATQLAGVDAGVIYEYDEQTEIFVPRATERLEVEIVETLIAAPVRKGEGATGRLAEAQAPIHLSDILEAPAESRVRETLGRAGYRALLAVPLVREGHLIGGLTVFRKAPGEFAPELIDLLQTFATQSGLAIQNARLFRELADKSRQLEAASQHKSEFLANMSHELRTPLNAIIGFSEVLSERMFGELNEKQDEYLKDIHASGQHLLSLINDILDLSKIEAGKMDLELADFDLPMTIENALMLVRERAARRGIELHRTVDERLGHIQADERKVRQVLLNLLSNAIKFTPEGGRIEVGAKAVNGLIEVSVTDTGVGIAPEDQEAVFEEFRQVGTADKKVEGTGLGLALSRKFIELHGGKIWVKSHVGAGSTFTFTVPVRHGE